MEIREIKTREMTVKSSDMEKEIFIEFDNKERHRFVIKALTRQDRIKISVNCSIARKGLSAESFTPLEVNLIERQETVNYGLIEKPEWWKSVDDCLEDSTIDRLYKDIQDWSDEFQENLKKNKYSK